MSKKTVDIETGEVLPDQKPYVGMDALHEYPWPTFRLFAKNQYNAEQFPNYYEANKQPSQTVPDQTLSLRTLLDRYAKGLPLSGNPNEPQYFGDEQMPDLNKMDISEIHDLKNAIKSDILQKQQDLHNQQAAAKKAAHEKSINDEVEKRVKSKTSDKSEQKEK